MGTQKRSFWKHRIPEKESFWNTAMFKDLETGSFWNIETRGHFGTHSCLKVITPCLIRIRSTPWNFFASVWPKTRVLVLGCENYLGNKFRQPNSSSFIVPSFLPFFLPSRNKIPPFLPSSLLACLLPCFLASLLPSFLPSLLSFLPSFLPSLLPSFLPSLFPSLLPSFLLPALIIA